MTKKRGAGARLRRIGPHGVGVEVGLCDHASSRFFERLYPLGIELEEFKEHVRNPTSAKKDEWDSRHGDPDRIKRWFNMTAATGDVRTVMVVFRVTREPSDLDAGAIEIVTVMVN